MVLTLSQLEPQALAASVKTWLLTAASAQWLRKVSAIELALLG